MSSETTEVRFEVQREEVAVLDGYCQGTGQDRTRVMRRILREWSDSKLHEATVVLRVAGRNPVPSEAGRA